MTLQKIKIIFVLCQILLLTQACMVEAPKPKESKDGSMHEDGVFVHDRFTDTMSCNDCHSNQRDIPQCKTAFAD